MEMLSSATSNVCQWCAMRKDNSSKMKHCTHTHTHTHRENTTLRLCQPRCRQTRHLKTCRHHCVLCQWQHRYLLLLLTWTPSSTRAAAAGLSVACSTCTGSSCAVKRSQNDWTSWGNVHSGTVSLRCAGGRARSGDVCAWTLCHRSYRRTAADLSQQPRRFCPTIRFTCKIKNILLKHQQRVNWGRDKAGRQWTVYMMSL